MPEKQKRRTFTAEFKQNAVDLIAKQGYSFAAASESLGVDPTTLRSWHPKLAAPQAPLAQDATVAELKAENGRLRRELQRVERERKILTRDRATLILTAFARSTRDGMLVIGCIHGKIGHLTHAT